MYLQITIERERKVCAKSVKNARVGKKERNNT
jgi:hypothetical protein